MCVYRDPEMTIEVTVGQIFVISLETLASEGYSWSEEHEPAIVELARPKQFVRRTSETDGDDREVLIGEGGDEEFEFRAKQPGSTQIKMKYKRDWDTSFRTTRIFGVVVKP